MIIQINYGDNKYSIKVESTQYVLVKHGVNNSKKSENFGQETEKELGYFSKMSNAVNKLIQDTFGDSEEILSLKEYTERVEAAYAQIKEQVDIIS